MKAPENCSEEYQKGWNDCYEYFMSIPNKAGNSDDFFKVKFAISDTNFMDRIYCGITGTLYLRAANAIEAGQLAERKLQTFGFPDIHIIKIKYDPLKPKEE